jgi:pimeloyl-ACP methyl ester carboxylesterase
MCDLGLAKRLHRITCPTLVTIGTEDRILSTRYLDVFARGIAGPVTARQLAGAGHLIDLDAPEALAELVVSHFTSVERRRESSAA